MVNTTTYYVYLNTAVSLQPQITYFWGMLRCDSILLPSNSAPIKLFRLSMAGTMWIEENNPWKLFAFC